MPGASRTTAGSHHATHSAQTCKIPAKTFDQHVRDVIRGRGHVEASAGRSTGCNCSVGMLTKLPLTLPCLYVTRSAAICMFRLARTNSMGMSRFPCLIMTAADSKVVGAVVDQEVLKHIRPRARCAAHNLINAFAVARITGTEVSCRWLTLVAEPRRHSKQSSTVVRHGSQLTKCSRQLH